MSQLKLRLYQIMGDFEVSVEGDDAKTVISMYQNIMRDIEKGKLVSVIGTPSLSHDGHLS